ncbi:hypothetical protein HZA57_09665 [Candidatus Poribacteria bacterium]|nr:hypothetical protein [Candidatus Poribacteria bacterium]
MMRNSTPPFLAVHKRSVTLMEMIIVCALWAMLCVGTMRVIGDARMLRSNARDRTTMALIAQGELDRIRQLPASELKAGTEPRLDDSWPASVHALVTLEERADGLWLLDVWVGRDSTEGKAPVRLATIRPGGTKP